jgi:DNA mismatch repair protein MutH
MKLYEAKRQIDKLAYIPFKEYLEPTVFQDTMLKLNKGRTGQLLELTIGLNLSNTTLDFEDGELKTNKCDRYGKPLETMFITQTASIIDELLSHKNFYQSKLYQKLQHLLYVPISKDGSQSDWMFLPCIEVDLSLPIYSSLAVQLEEDYYSICDQFNAMLQVSSTSMLHTASGKFIQIRTKDSKPYHPIYSEIYHREVSDKNRAFYFKKEFMRYIVLLNS